MLQPNRLRIAIQKKGRLFKDSISLLERCGLKFRIDPNALAAKCENLELDILLVRDDDIPTLVMDGICDLGIVGENVLLEKELLAKYQGNNSSYKKIKELGFGRCKLAVAIADDKPFNDIKQLNGTTIATSYPNLLQNFLNKNDINAEVLNITGSVEISPRLGMADAICDLVSTGKTLEENNLKDVITIVKSQAVLIENPKMNQDKKELTKIILSRINGVLQAQESKYIMFHAKKSQLAAIKEILPGSENPTIMQLDGTDDKVAVHVVSSEKIFWETLEQLKTAGASSILVMPIEKMMR